MAQAYDGDFLNKPRELDAELRYTNPSQTPFYTMLSADNTLRGTKYEPSIEKYETGPTAPIHEGADVQAGEITTTVPVTVVCRSQIFRAPTGITNVANVVETGTEKKGAQLGKQIATRMVALKRKAQCTLLSAQEGSPQVGTNTTPMATRGAFKWLESAAQAVDPVPDGFRPDAGVNFSGALDAFTEDALQGMLDALWTQTEGAVGHLDCFAGIKFKRKVDNFTRLTEVAAGMQSVRRFEQDDIRSLVNTVQRLNYSGMEIDMHVQAHILTDLSASGAATAYTDKSAIFLDLDKWRIGFNQAPVVEELPNAGGGPKRNPNMIGMLICKNPLSGMTAKINALVTTP